MKKIITGATGFLGSHLVFDLLERGNAVTAMKRAASSMEEFMLIKSLRKIDNCLLSRLQWVEGDILDSYSLAEIFEPGDEVYHTAATVSFWGRNRDLMMKTNAEGTANVVNTCLEKRVKKLCYASSIAAIGREKTDAEIGENTLWADSKYNTNYAISKYLAEMEVWRGIEEGLNAVMVNPGIILGEGRWDKGSARLFSTAAKGFPFYTTGMNGYVDVLDVSRAMIQLMESDISAERFIMVSENLVFRDFFNKVSDCFGKPHPKIKVGPLLSHAAKYLFGLKSLLDGKEPLVTKETARNSQHTFIYSNEKLKKQLGFAFTPIDETIKRICENYKLSQSLNN